MMKKHKPPKMFELMLRIISKSEERFSVIGDFQEIYGQIAVEKSILHALRWYGFQILKSIPLFCANTIYWTLSMLRNYLIITLRNIKNYKIYSLLNITGLAVGLAAFILIGLYVQYELSFDKYHENADRIYRVVKKEGRTFTAAPLGPALKENFPEVEAVTRIIQSQKMLISHEQDHFLEETFYWAGPETFKIFTIPFIIGDSETALRNPNSIVLSQRTAKKYFGNEEPLGKILTVNNRTNFTVAGIFSDMPANSHFTMDIIVPYDIFFLLLILPPIRNLFLDLRL